MAGFRLSDERYEEIKEIVVDMFDCYQVSCVPISGFEIATKMGVIVVPYSVYDGLTQTLLLKESEDGFFCETTDGELYIFYNDAKRYGRINHTIMHEIAHITLNHTEDSELADAEVGFFAKYALAPPVLIYKLKLDNPHEIAEVFEISLEAADYAYSYYQKWKTYGNKFFTPYEMKTLELFKEVV